MDAKLTANDERLTTGAHEPDSRAPLVILVHGGRHDGWCWSLVQKRLEDAGVESAAPDLPLTSLSAQIDLVRALLAALGTRRKALLVGHSRGGRVLSAAASGATNVVCLVYVAGMLLEEDELHPQGRHPRSPTELTGEIDAEDVRRRMYHDVPDPLFREALRHLRPMSLDGVAVEPQSVPAAWRTLPTTYVVCTDDRYIAPEAQRAMARHADEVVELASSHAPYFSCPGRLASLIAERVRRFESS